MKSFWKKTRVLPSGEIGVPESAVQQACEDFLRIKQIEFFHVPDKSFSFVELSSLPRSFKAWFKTTFAGKPDIVFTLPVKDHYGLSFKVELKTRVGKTHGAQTREVKAGRWALCRSLDEFQAVVEVAEALAERMRT